MNTGELLHGAVALSSVASRYRPGEPTRLSVPARQHRSQPIVQSLHGGRLTTTVNVYSSMPGNAPPLQVLLIIWAAQSWLTSIGAGTGSPETVNDRPQSLLK